MDSESVRLTEKTTLQDAATDVAAAAGETHRSIPKRSVRPTKGWAARHMFVLLLLPLAFLLVLLALAQVYTLILSLRPFEQGIIKRDTFTLFNYRRFLLDPFYLKILGRTLSTAMLTVIATIFLGYPVAYYVSRAKRFRTMLIGLCLAPLLISSVIRTFSWVYVLGNSGLVNQALQALGLISAPIQFIYNFPGVVIGLTHVFLPFMILSLLAALENIDQTLEEAARSLGANGLRAFVSITLPLSTPGIVAGSLLVFTLSCASYITPAALGSKTDRLLSVLTYDVFYEGGNWPFGSAIAFIILVVALTVTVVYYRLMERQMGGQRQ